MTAMKRILIVDDERNVHFAFRRALEGEYEILSAHDGEEALETLGRDHPDVVLLDVRLPRLGGLETLERIHAARPGLPVIVMTAFGTVDTAIRATALSARDYLLKPIDVPSLKKLLEELAPRNGDAPGAAAPLVATGAMVGHSPAMQDLFKLIGRAAASDSTVLVTGESGTGKELIARAIHDHGPRRSGPYVAINCAAIPASLLESELFGHERGAFTGAAESRPGKFELAHRGTILLDEIGEMDAALQAKLLRVLQGREVTRLGGATPRPLDVRVIALTNVDLEAQVTAGRFREDLYYRLNVFRIQVPPLRERRGDVGSLAHHFLERERSRLGRPELHFAPECAAWLETHPWPGNVRELENVVSQAILRTRGDRIRPEDLILRTPRPRGTEPFRDDPHAFGGDPDARFEAALASFLEAHPGEGWDRLEHAAVARALALCGGNQVHAARLLGVTRNVLRARMAKHAL